MAGPRFVPVDLTELAEAGVLMLVNERVLWPLGLALAWERAEDGAASGLHVRQWEFEDGHREIIAQDEDEVTRSRRAALRRWAQERRDLLPVDEVAGLDDLLAGVPE